MDAISENACVALTNSSSRDLVRALAEKEAVKARDVYSRGELPGAYHNSLPKLKQYGFIDYHERSGVIVRGPNYGRIKTILELIEAIEA